MSRVLPAIVFVLAAAAPASAQFDVHRMEDVENQALLKQGRAFAVGVGARLPVQIVGLEEIKNPDGRFRFAVRVKNVSDAPVPAYTVSAAVVQSDGLVKAFQKLNPIKQLRPGQVRRQEFVVRVAVPAHTDLVALAVAEVERASGEPWKADEAALVEAIQRASQRVQK